MPSVTLTLSALDPITSSTTILTEGTLSAKNVTFNIGTTAYSNVTAVVTGLTLTETKAGAPIFKAGSIGSIFATTNDTLPFYIKRTSGSNGTSFTVNVSATGNQGAIGIQTLTYAVVLSSTALSGNSNNSTIVPVDVSTVDLSLATTLSAINTPFANRACKAEHLRLANLGII